MDQLRILVIEDDVDQRELIRETLEDCLDGEVHVTDVGTRREALAQNLKSFDLILSDYNLPDATGLEILEDLRQRCATPVIMVTGENVAHVAVEAIRKGATDYIIKTGDYLFTIPVVVQKNLIVAKIRRENEQLRAELEKALRDVCDKNALLERSLQKVEELAATDPLTGLYNRRHFAKVLDQLFADAQRFEKDMSCVMIDLDKYKQINDSLGHQVGDQILILAGQVIGENMRRMDVAARYGGDEFVLLLPQASAADAAAVAQRIRLKFKPVSAELLKRNDGLSMSIGIASITGNRVDHADQLVRLADQALYRSKEAGRDRVSLAGAA